jgi:voltage-gated sodium channel
MILLAGALAGLSTYPSVETRWGAVIAGVEHVVLLVFIVEIFLRIAAEGRRPWMYFADSWNVFDFTIVAACLLPFGQASIAVLRMVRVLRVLRLLKAMPQLRMIVQTLLKSLSSIGCIALLLGIHFYIFAVLGVSFFRDADSHRFGSLQSAMLTLFQVLTLENWPDVMAPLRASAPVFAPAYFIVFIVLGTMIMMNLFIGVIINGMTEAQADIARNGYREAEEKGMSATVVAVKELAVMEHQLEQMQTQLAALRTHFETHA